VRRLFRFTFKLGAIVAVGVGIAVVVKKLTAPPEDSSASLEPWPPLKTDETTGLASSSTASGEKLEAPESQNGDGAAGNGEVEEETAPSGT
jgi:hypothetical protein